MVDAANLVALLGANAAQQSDRRPDIKAVVEKYEDEMMTRTRPATLKARQACIDANHYANVKSGSPFLSRRTMLNAEENDIKAWAK